VRQPWHIKSGYASAEAGMNAVEVMLRLYLLKFYVDVVGLAPLYAGFAMAVTVAWDAVTDPVMGVLSDRTRSRFGRRRPWIALGALGLAVSVVLIFSPPPGLPAGLWLLATGLLLNTALTLLSVPHNAYARELSFDPDERTAVMACRLLAGNLGLLAGVTLPGLLRAQWPEATQRAAYSWAATGLALLVLTSAALTLLAMGGDRSRKPNALPLRWRDSVRVLRLNPDFAVLLLAFVIANLGLSVNSAVALLYYERWLRLSEGQTLVVLAVFIAVFCAALWLWLAVSRRAGKRRPAFWALLGLGVMTTLVYPLLPRGVLWPALLPAVFGGLLVGAIVLFDSLLADTLDYDELRTRRQREGLYFGLWRFAGKLARAGALALTGAFLQLLDYGGEAADGAERALALLFGPGVGLWFIASALIFRRMPLSAARHARIQALLQRRREQDRDREGNAP